MVEILHAPGFLGTNANFAADMTLVASMLVAVIFTIGMVVAKYAQHLEEMYPQQSREGSRAASLFAMHRVIQTSGAVLNVILVLWLMILPYRDFILLDRGGPREGVFYALTTLHALVGMFTFFFGIFVVLRGNNLMIPALRFDNYKPYMRIAYLAYLVTTALGVGVYIIWFTVIPNTPVY